ncbi:hypothetical protein [Sphingomonas montanisoli]|uniref:Uncharacterized protein n=1 Tax=Sphingomonas montanisoli TaxID=2606412 RepID=A0A5D9C6C9_9SPHN|nr:hypothetical protein [Sphingomonas montanisoli]TZG27239.1 hypothetical protein FYJ91_06345 [Sphingomonas montanisoli]
MEEVSTIEQAVDQVSDKLEAPITGSSEASTKAKNAARPSSKSGTNKAGSASKAGAAKAIPASKKDIASKPSKPAAAPWTFPKTTLEEAIKIARAIEEQNAGNPMKPDMLAKAVGYNSVADWRFLDLLRAANQYGLVTGSGKISPVGLTQIGQDVVAPSAPTARPKALMAAFRSVEDFQKVEDFYNGKKLPEDEFFENNLYREFGIPRERVKSFIETFTSNLNYLHAFRPDRSGTGPVVTTEFRQREPDVSGIDDGGTGRQFLDTCFVMMPFGQWMDAYYREIFVPAIREAGLEPIRADELFSTGSVIEQIWEQISRAKVLLADLTGKNANVFYELGLAHAANKPVVFTTGDLEDVPFDLRHLRVAVYDIRDPAWGEKLRNTLSVYLKAAKADPGKSVPQPFRKQMAVAE